MKDATWLTDVMQDAQFILNFIMNDSNKALYF